VISFDSPLEKSLGANIREPGLGLSLRKLNKKELNNLVKWYNE
jgi:hypothetical protein